MKLRSLLLSALVAATGIAAAQAVAPLPPPELPMAPAPTVQAKAWVLMDAASGQVLAGHDANARMAPASITKVMTSYVIAAELAAGRVHANDQVLMSENAWRKGGAGTDGSYSGFPVNSRAPLTDMEKGMVVQSGNDAAIALAEHVAGSEDAFVGLMNAYAQRLGLKDTHFADVTGLSAEGHYSSAHDLALLGRALARDFPASYAYNAIKEYTVGPITQRNRNLLLWRDGSVDGIKTGHTSEAGYCLMASAKRGDTRLIAVVLDDVSENQRAVDAQALLNWGFRFFEGHQLYAPGKAVTTQRVWKGEADQVGLGVATPLLVTVPRGQYGKLKASMQLPKALVAPLKTGQAVGTVTVSLDGKPIASQPLVVMQAVPQAGFFGRLWDSLLMWWHDL